VLSTKGNNLLGYRLFQQLPYRFIRVATAGLLKQRQMLCQKLDQMLVSGFICDHKLLCTWLLAETPISFSYLSKNHRRKQIGAQAPI
jgi:hypothetical protein